MVRILRVSLLSFWLVGSLSPPASGGENPGPDINQLQNELQFQIPTMWKVTGFTIQDSFRETTGEGPVWKARFRADIETSEPTYVPTDLNVGAVTVVRAAYSAGVKRQVSGRVAASTLPSGGWILNYTLDNRPTMTAGLPLRYFVGRVVVAGSEEHAALVDDLAEERVKLAVQKHEAALKTLRAQHDAELRSAKDSLEQVDELEKAEAGLGERVGALQQTLQTLQLSVDTLKTASVSPGIALSQWAERGFDSTIVEKRGSTAAEIAGAPDAEVCNPKRRAINAWFVGGHEKGEQKVTISFLEPVIPTEVVIFETAGTGFVKSLEFTDSDGEKKFSESVVDSAEGCAAQAVFPIVGITSAVDRITITIDADREGNKAIDAVMLKGMKTLE